MTLIDPATDIPPPIGVDPRHPDQEDTALAALAARPHLICHSAFFIERLGVDTWRPPIPLANANALGQ